MATRGILAVLLASMLLVGGMAAYYAAQPAGIGLESFRTRAEFQVYITNLLRGAPGSAADSDGSDLRTLGELSDTTTAAGGGFSGTNVQVAGVDEADSVKTDGRFLYLVAGGDVVILRVHPPTEMRTVSRITAEDLVGDRNASHHVVGLFLSAEVLVVIARLYSHNIWAEDGALIARSWGSRTTLVSLFSILDPEHPVLLHEFELTGEHRASRMKDATVYLVLHQYLRMGQEEASYPAICEDGACRGYAASRIYFDPEVREVGSFTNIVALDLVSGEKGYISVLTGYASTVYMSLANLYVTFGKWGQGAAFRVGGAATATTSIYRIAVDGLELRPVAGGEVSGWLLNQFSLDEHGSHLRVATTTGSGELENHVYVLDEDLEVVGALEGLAPGESIYAARFVGDLGYLVTFKKVDPFFVLDLSDPRRPEVLGYLKIPGFSEYLHPMDETHILGVGKDTVEDASGQFAWFQGLKLSLFDVSDVRQPVEVAKLLLGNRGSSSPVLHDHKAFLYIRQAGLVVLPVYLVSYTEPPDGGDVPPWTYGTERWQGAMVLSVTPEGGFEILTQISHVPLGEDACLEYGNQPYAVFRSLYVGEYLYTISPTTLQAHALDDFSEAGSLVYDDPAGHWEC
ncbi:MAG: beta-propeller domain-containing protein [Thermoplasmata archaeon]